MAARPRTAAARALRAAARLASAAPVRPTPSALLNAANFYAPRTALGHVS